MEHRHPTHKGRGAVSNPAGRFARDVHEAVADEWVGELEDLAPLETIVRAETARTIISRNQSPDVPFEQSINPYRGCEQGCVYCFARPTHSYLDLSPGLDFETRLFYKENAAELLETELRKPNYRCKPIVIGINTDAYQPIERKLGITRGLLEIMLRYRHPCSLLTKGLAIERDIDLLAELARHKLVSVSFSVTTLDDDLKRRLEPRAASGKARLRAIHRLSEAGVPVGVLVAPVIPALTDHELETLLKQAAQAGAQSAGYVLLRLPHEVRDLFVDWLETHYPDRAEHVMSLVRQSRGGKDYDSRWGHRMRGTGQFADLLAQRFRLACKKHGFGPRALARLSTGQFRVPARRGDQLSLSLR